MSATARLFKCCLDAVPAQFPLEFQQVIKGVFVVGIDRYPLGTLRLRVQGVNADCDLAVQVLTDCVPGQPAVIPRAVLIVLALWVRLVRLHGIGQAIHEQAKVSCRHFRRHLA
jgi:hypothetical protein